MATNKKKIFIFLIFISFFTSQVKSLTNNVIVTIDNSIITELDVKKEIEFIKFINKIYLNDWKFILSLFYFSYLLVNMLVSQLLFREIVLFIHLKFKVDPFRFNK